MSSCITLAIVALAAIPLATAADDVPPPLKVADVRAIVGDWIVLRAETEGRVIRWKSLDRGLRIAPAELALRDPKATLATASRPGKYRVICVTAKGDVPSEIVEFLVTVEPDGPEPPPDPKPPEPSDPLTRKLREAFQADPGDPAAKREYLAVLAGFYSAMAKHVSADQVATVGDLLSDYRNAIPAVLPESAIPAVRKVCGEETATIAGDDPERKIDAGLKSKLVDLFTRLASALDAVKGK
jgi:hypothetical protein